MGLGLWEVRGRESPGFSKSETGEQEGKETRTMAIDSKVYREGNEDVRRQDGWKIESLQVVRTECCVAGVSILDGCR